MIFSGLSPDRKLVEICELKDHPWMVACQFHPEFTSRPGKPQPLFRDFIGAAKDVMREGISSRLAAGHDISYEVRYTMTVHDPDKKQAGLSFGFQLFGFVQDLGFTDLGFNMNVYSSILPTSTRSKKAPPWASSTV